MGKVVVVVVGVLVVLEVGLFQCWLVGSDIG